MIKIIFAMSILCLAFPFYALANDDAEQMLREVSNATKKTQSLNGNYEIRLRHLEPYQEIREEGSLRLLRPNYLMIKGQSLLPSKTTGKWEKFAEANSYFSDGNIFYTLFPQNADVTYQKANAEINGRNILIKLSPIADFFDENNSFMNQIALAKNKNILTSVQFTGDTIWENSNYKVVEFVTDEIEKNTPRHRVTQIYIGKDNLIHRVTSTEKFGDLISENETILKNLSSLPNPAAKDFSYVLPADAKPYVAPLPPLEKGTQIPEITLADKTGKKFNLSDLRGKTVILDFWATWCLPCLKSFPQTAGILKKYGADKVAVVAVNIWDDPEGASGWIARHPEFSSIAFARDVENVTGKDSPAIFHVSKLPLQYVISPNGTIVSFSEGYLGSSSELDEAVKASQNF